MSLTPKQEAFALAFFETGNAAEAYRRSYDVSENAKDQWIYVEACQLLDNPKITLRLQELREHAERHSIYTRQQALDEYETARQLAVKTANPSAVVSAINGKVKLFGLEAPVKTKVDLSSSDSSMKPPTLIQLVPLKGNDDSPD
ncbi:terminase small subunit [Ochrobactrum quorumnocens]|uniref:Terminase small subunit n=1 Tax=Ochrobactrum quorumnocens TaxID=271865 RepID=A0A5N1K8B0_9HYPH|nr:terminase small subunit [[Ochrobactrum] quorumnocens]KAA9370921.1 terminase small subunit [[Ochrobactrum] quorumnocens]